MSHYRPTPPPSPRRLGYLAYLAGLGDPCPYPDNSVEAIDWRDGWAVAERVLRELDEDGPFVM